MRHEQHNSTNEERQQTVLRTLTQPLTAKQVARRLQMPREACSTLLRQLTRHGLVQCLNDGARRSRVYGLTGRGCAWYVADTGPSVELPRPSIPAHVNWTLYGWVCFSQRMAVLKALTEPLQPVAIKRRARLADPHLRMSANNVRDVIRGFLKKGIVYHVQDRKRGHPRYALTRRGQMLHDLVIAAETRDPIHDA